MLSIELNFAGLIPGPGHPAPGDRRGDAGPTAATADIDRPIAPAGLAG